MVFYFQYSILHTLLHHRLSQQERVANLLSPQLSTPIHNLAVVRLELPDIVIHADMLTRPVQTYTLSVDSLS